MQEEIIQENQIEKAEKLKEKLISCRFSNRWFTNLSDEEKDVFFKSTNFFQKILHYLKEDTILFIILQKFKNAQFAEKKQNSVIVFYVYSALKNVINLK